MQAILWKRTRFFLNDRKSKNVVTRIDYHWWIPKRLNCLANKRSLFKLYLYGRSYILSIPQRARIRYASRSFTENAVVLTNILSRDRGV